MSTFYARLALVSVILLQLSTSVYAGPLDDYYLQQFGETKSVQLQKALLSVTADVQESAHCGMPLKHGLRRDWNLLEQSTQKTLAKQLALPTLGSLGWASENTFISAANHFKVHYTTVARTSPPLARDDRPPLDDLDNDGVPDWVETVAATFENVYTSYTAQGYRPAPTTGNAPYDLYLLDLAPQRYYGLTNSDQDASSTGFPNAVTSWMEIDNNFTEDIYTKAFGGPYSPLQSLQITASHEYHHAVQYGYTYYFDIWYAEATSTWMEDELYDDVNQLYNYIPAWFNQSRLSLDTPESTSTGGGYGRWIFNRYLSEKHGPAAIRGVWESVAGIPSPGNGADIPMAPVLDSLLSSTYGSSLGNDFFGFSKRVYIRDWTDHSNDAAKIHVYSPIATYAAYPVNSTVSTPTPSVTLPHYSFAYYKFTPTAGVTSLTISINKTSGIQTALFKNGSELTAVSSTSAFASYATSGLGTSDEIVLLIANITVTDGHSANFSTDGKLLAVTEPTTPPSSTSGGSGCFIATAAYGSYLHPQVQLLRNFRDDYLLTNAPGRAFVALYYHFSPPLADYIARHPVLRGVTRLALTPLVIAAAHPLALGVFLLLLTGALLHRIKTARLKAHPDVIRTT